MNPHLFARVLQMLLYMFGMFGGLRSFIHFIERKRRGPSASDESEQQAPSVLTDEEKIKEASSHGEFVECPKQH